MSDDPMVVQDPLKLNRAQRRLLKRARGDKRRALEIAQANAGLTARGAYSSAAGRARDAVTIRLGDVPNE